jgi:hypothetical protein
MRKIFFVVFFLVACGDLFAQDSTTFSSQIYGYKRDMVYYDCLQSPFIRQEFYTNPGEDHTYTFKTDNLVSISVNGAVNFVLQPKDSLSAVIKYEGRRVQSVSLSGTDKALSANSIIWDLELYKRLKKYRPQLLGCVALDVKPKARIEDSKDLHNKTVEMLNKAGNTITLEAKNYILSDIEGAVYNSFMEYPVMYADVRKVSIDKQDIGDYWTIMDGVTLRDDQASLASIEYVSMLMRYCFYMNELKAYREGKKYSYPSTLEKIYSELTSFYSGNKLDATLFMLISNFIREGKEIERVEPLIKEYREKYNINPKYIEILDSLLQ